MPGHLSQLTPTLFVYHGNCNVGILRHGERALLIDCGNGTVQETFGALGITQIERILFTHHHRDSASGVHILADATTRLAVPHGERRWFEEVEEFWNDPKMRWHLYNVHPHDLMLAESVPIHDEYAHNDTLQWGDAQITVLDTPGHTDGSISYLLEVAGERFVFCGDTIYAEGQLWDLYSLQKGGGTITDYHGFLGDRQRLLASLAQILAHAPTALIPTHGQILHHPAQAITTLRQRLDHCYDQYVAISALRYYFPAMFAEFAENPTHLPIRPGKAVPPFLRHVSTTWLIIAANGEAFVMDCGTPAVLQALAAWQASGEIRRVTGCWVTHYHDDHVDAMPTFQAEYPCPTYADQRVASIIEQPRAWRIPCISPAVTRVDQRTQEGETWHWNEFRLTAYHCPGQTYYHGGLLVEGHGVRLFFSGDSFTPAGIDDYCAGNRNLLGADVGFDHCLALIERLQPTHIFNCHVDLAFDFTAQEIAHMRRNLAERQQSYGVLLPWDHPNYGLDEHWVRCLPYEQDVVAGQIVHLRVEFTNHSITPQLVCCRPILPNAWGVKVPEQTSLIAAQSDGFVDFAITIPPPATHELPGEPAAPQAKRVVIPIDIDYGGRPLGQFRQAIFVVQI